MLVSILAATLGCTLILVMPLSSGLTYHLNIHRSGGVGEGGCLHLYGGISSLTVVLRNRCNTELLFSRRDGLFMDIRCPLNSLRDFSNSFIPVC